MDDSCDGHLDPYEFSKACSDFGVSVDPKDIDGLFKAFDTNRDGRINYNEFVRAIVGPMNPFRTQIAIRAFKSLDYNGDASIRIDDISKRYNASFHPDVKSGKRTEEEVLSEFLETFE